MGLVETENDMHVSDEEKFIKVLKDANKKLGAFAREKDARNADIESAGHRLAMELECLLLDTKDLAIVSRWWDTGMEALTEWQALHEYNGPRLWD